MSMCDARKKKSYHRAVTHRLAKKCSADMIPNPPNSHPAFFAYLESDASDSIYSCLVPFLSATGLLLSSDSVNRSGARLSAARSSVTSPNAKTGSPTRSSRHFSLRWRVVGGREVWSWGLKSRLRSIFAVGGVVVGAATVVKISCSLENNADDSDRSNQRRVENALTAMVPLRCRSVNSSGFNSRFADRADTTRSDWERDQVPFRPEEEVVVLVGAPPRQRKRNTTGKK